jgi:hypothetical protein
VALEGQPGAAGQGLPAGAAPGAEQQGIAQDIAHLNPAPGAEPAPGVSSIEAAEAAVTGAAQITPAGDRGQIVSPAAGSAERTAAPDEPAADLRVFEMLGARPQPPRSQPVPAGASALGRALGHLRWIDGRLSGDAYRPQPVDAPTAAAVSPQLASPTDETARITPRESVSLPTPMTLLEPAAEAQEPSPGVGRGRPASRTERAVDAPARQAILSAPVVAAPGAPAIAGQPAAPPAQPSRELATTPSAAAPNAPAVEQPVAAPRQPAAAETPASAPVTLAPSAADATPALANAAPASLPASAEPGAAARDPGALPQASAPLDVATASREQLSSRGPGETAQVVSSAPASVGPVAAMPAAAVPGAPSATAPGATGPSDPAAAQGPTRAQRTATPPAASGQTAQSAGEERGSPPAPLGLPGAVALAPALDGPAAGRQRAPELSTLASAPAQDPGAVEAREVHAPPMTLLALADEAPVSEGSQPRGQARGPVTRAVAGAAAGAPQPLQAPVSLASERQGAPSVAPVAQGASAPAQLAPAPASTTGALPTDSPLGASTGLGLPVSLLPLRTALPGERPASSISIEESTGQAPVPWTAQATPGVRATESFLRHLAGFQAAQDSKLLPVPTYRPWAAEISSSPEVARTPRPALSATAPEMSAFVPQPGPQASGPRPAVEVNAPPMTLLRGEPAAPEGERQQGARPRALPSEAARAVQQARQAGAALASRGEVAAPGTPAGVSAFLSPDAQPTAGAGPQASPGAMPATASAPAEARPGTSPVSPHRPVEATLAEAGAGLAPALATAQLASVRPGGVGALAESFGAQVGTRAASLAIDFVDPQVLFALGQGGISPAQAAMLGGLGRGERLFASILTGAGFGLPGPASGADQTTGSALPGAPAWSAAAGVAPWLGAYATLLPQSQEAEGQIATSPRRPRPQVSPAGAPGGTYAAPAPGSTMAAAAEPSMQHPMTAQGALAPLAQPGAQAPIAAPTVLWTSPAASPAMLTPGASSWSALVPGGEAAAALPWTVLRLFPAAARSLFAAGLGAPAGPALLPPAGPLGSAVGQIPARWLPAMSGSHPLITAQSEPQRRAQIQGGSARGATGGRAPAAPAGLSASSATQALAATATTAGAMAAPAAPATDWRGAGDSAPLAASVGADFPALSRLLASLSLFSPAASQEAAADGFSSGAFPGPGPGPGPLLSSLPSWEAAYDAVATDEPSAPGHARGRRRPAAPSLGLVAGRSEELAATLTRSLLQAGWLPPATVRAALSGTAASERGVPMWGAMEPVHLDAVEGALDSAPEDDAQPRREGRDGRPQLAVLQGGRQAERTGGAHAAHPAAASPPSWPRQAPEATLLTAPLMQGRPPTSSGDASAKLLDAVRAHAAASAAASDERITLGDLTLIAMAASQDQMAAATSGNAPAAVQHDEAIAGMPMKGETKEDRLKMHFQVQHLVNQILDEINFRNRIEDERYGEQ